MFHFLSPSFSSIVSSCSLQYNLAILLLCNSFLKSSGVWLYSLMCNTAAGKMNKLIQCLEEGTTTRMMTIWLPHLCYILHYHYCVILFVEYISNAFVVCYCVRDNNDISISICRKWLSFSHSFAIITAATTPFLCISICLQSFWNGISEEKTSFRFHASNCSIYLIWIFTLSYNIRLQQANKHFPNIYILRKSQVSLCRRLVSKISVLIR